MIRSLAVAVRSAGRGAARCWPPSSWRAGRRQDTGVVAGTVVDSTNQVVPVPLRRLTNENTGDVRTLVSNERGEFSFRAVTPGSYSVRWSSPGFRTIEQRTNVLNASGQLDVGRMRLERSGPSPRSSRAGQRHVRRDQEQRLLRPADREADLEHPDKGRDVVNLLRLPPGVHYENDIDALGDSFRIADPEIAGQAGPGTR